METENSIKTSAATVANEEILSLLADHVRLAPLDGKKYIFKEKKATIRDDEDFINWNLNKPGVATPEAIVRVDEMINNGTLMEIFSSLPGQWKDKWLSQNQVIEFCEKNQHWLLTGGYATMFLIKKNEYKEIDEANPQSNLVVVYAVIFNSGVGYGVRRLGLAATYIGGLHRRVVSPFERWKTKELPIFISKDNTCVIPPLDGKTLIYESPSVFHSHICYDFIGCGLTIPGIATKETILNVNELIGRRELYEIFSPVNGIDWEKKCVTQSQIVYFCENYSGWLDPKKNVVIFLCRINENIPVDDNKPQDNLSIVHVTAYHNGLFARLGHLYHSSLAYTDYPKVVVFPQYK